MNFSADKARRKWPIAALYRRPPPMVTAIVAFLVAFLALDTSPVAARRSHHPDLFSDLFGFPRVRQRGTVHRTKPAHEAPAAESKAGSMEKEKEAKVPLPQPRPAEAPKVEPEKPATAKAPPAEPDKPAGPAATAIPMPTPRPTPTPAPPSACRLALTEEIAIAPSVPDIHGPGDCGGEDLVRLEAIVLPDKHRVSLKPAATMRCGMATAIADWVRTDIAPLAQSLGSEPADLENFDAYECRGRNGISGAPLSEHGRANALDVHAFKLANGQSIGLTDRDVPRSLRESALHTACTRFTTVLGPGSDGYHEDHIHLDLLQRHNNYKICQWDVWDPLPRIAPLMPAERPAEAPPREVAGKEDGGKKDGGKADAAPTGSTEATGDKSDEAAETKSDARKVKPSKSKSDESKPDKSKSNKSKSDKSQPDKSDSDKSATKKRRHSRRY
jgi:hypothetical protein